MKVNYLPINREEIEKRPDKFITTIDKIELIFEISWNPEMEAFFFKLYDYEENPILLGRRIVYGEDMLATLIDERIPDVKIIPLDKTGAAEREGITFENFMVSVKPYIIEGDSQ